MAVPEKFQFANEFGILRKEGVFSTIDVRNIKKQSKEAIVNSLVKRLRIPQSVRRSDAKGLTTTLIDPTTGCEFVFPMGSVIKEVSIIDLTNGNLDCDLAFMLGYLSDSVDDRNQLALLAQRIAPADAQISGRLLSKFNSLHIDQRLNVRELAVQKAIYDPYDAMIGQKLTAPNYAIVRGNNYLGESRSLKPCITVTSGELCISDLDFLFSYNPPNDGFVSIDEDPCAIRDAIIHAEEDMVDSGEMMMRRRR